ncbi:cobalt ECF transporter T component CbiQ [Mycobacterium sp. SMC-4]|uniref:cobalt ECF transporter T component CbiQ n=1 Tax=Mycobacterium sp. SMC-4 TaxID=2857059 RepID=UPI003D06325E
MDTVAWNSRWRTRSVLEKVVLCGGLLACAVVLPPWPAAPLVLVGAVVAGRLAGLPNLHLMRMLRVPLVFIVVAGASTAVSVDPAGPTFTTSAEAVLRACETAARAIAATAAVMLLASTTPMSDLTDSMRRIGLPSACVDVITVMYRMIFLLLESLTVIRKSQTARLGYSGVRRSVRSAGLLTAAVLVRAWRRGQALERGLAGRNLGMPLARPESPAVSSRFVASAALVNAAVVSVSLLVALR